MNFIYDIKYDSSLLRGNDDPKTPRPWNLRKEILKFAHKNKTLLDIGCGTSFKLIPLFSYFKQVTAIDISHQMAVISKKNFYNTQVNNVAFITGSSEQLPFIHHTFDVITSMLSRCHVSEAYRTLKPTGVVIAEYPGCEDKKEFKKIFGKDKNGWRGQFINFELKEFISMFYRKYRKHFNYVEIRSGFWNTYYTEAGIIELLKYTPTIKNFDFKKDRRAIEVATDLFMTTYGIKLKQHRILIYATNYRANCQLF